MSRDTEAAPRITQAMIDAYDEYTHLTLDRRRFMERLTALAGSGAAAAAIAPPKTAPNRSAKIPPNHLPSRSKTTPKGMLGNRTTASIAATTRRTRPMLMY